MLLNKVKTLLGILIFYMCKEKNNTLNLAFKYKVIWLFFLRLWKFKIQG